MTQQETWQLEVAVMQARIDGKEIEYRERWSNDPGARKWKPIDFPAWDWYNHEYRVKPEKEYRPYNSLAEFCMGYLEHGRGNNLKNKYDTQDGKLPCTVLVDRFHPAMGCHERSELNMQELFDNYTWPDGTPCGIETIE